MISYLALAFALQAAHPVTPPRRLQPRIGDYFTVDDYPAAAREARESGRVDVRLTVGGDGASPPARSFGPADPRRLTRPPAASSSIAPAIDRPATAPECRCPARMWRS